MRRNAAGHPSGHVVPGCVSSLHPERCVAGPVISDRDIVDEIKRLERRQLTVKHRPCHVVGLKTASSFRWHGSRMLAEAPFRYLSGVMIAAYVVLHNVWPDTPVALSFRTNITTMPQVIGRHGKHRQVARR